MSIKSESNSQLLAVCGLYCGACYHYLASFPENVHLLEEGVRKGKIPEGYSCQGCRSEKLYIHPGCVQCKLRDCANRKQIQHCGVCKEFPCELLENFRVDGHIHHRDIYEQLRDLKRQGPEQWLREQQQRWKCECGNSYSWYETVCQQCGQLLHSYLPGS